MKKQRSTETPAKQEKTISKKVLLSASFIEGAMVISVELLGAKMLIPLFGNSLIVWTAALGMTITFLALGYFAGGVLSQKKALVKKMSLVFAIASLLILFMPTLAGVLFEWLLGTSVYPGSVIAATLLLGPPLFTLGIVSPMLIQQLVDLEKTGRSDNYSGLSAGMVFAISTFGGIIFTFILGFFALPQWGISIPILLVSTGLLFLSCYFYYEKKYLVFIITFFLLTLNLVSDQKATLMPNSKILYSNEGLLGQLKVVDIFDPGYNAPFRYLFINGIPQSVIINDESTLKGSSGWPYIHKMAILASLKKHSQHTLLLGIGGGSIAHELGRMKMKADLVDLDARTFSVAQKYFYLDDSLAQFTCDDARHFINTSKILYDLVIMDVFIAEVQPSYLFTRESFAEMKRTMTKNGILVLQFGEQTKHEGPSAYQSVCNTLMAEGFRVYIDLKEEENVTDALIIASPVELDLSKIKKEDLNACCTAQPWFNDFMKKPAERIEKSFDNGIILTDDKPVLEMLNTGTVRTWREWAAKTYAEPEIKGKRKLFR